MKVVDYKKLKGLKQSQFRTQSGAFPQSGFFVSVSDICMLSVIDAEKVIYCVNCKNRNTEGCPMTYWDNGKLVDTTKDKDYCSYAEE